MTALATLSRAPADTGTPVLTPAVPTRQISYRRAPRGLWWTTPIGSLLMVVPLSLLIAVQIPDGDYRYFYKVPRVISGSQAGLFLLAAGVLALGTLIPLAARPALVRVDRSRLPDEQLAVLRIAEVVAFRTTMLGYIFLAGAGIVRGARPANLLDAVTSQNNYSGQLKAQFAPIAGVTSFTQIGIAYVVLAGILLCHGRSSHLVRRLLIVLILGLSRAFLLTERLALLELLVPLVAIGAANLRQRPRRGSWLPAAPILALPLLMTIFGAFEYSRSWVFYRSRTTLSFPQFVVNRLAGYYATSYNNGALELAHTHTANRLPYSTFEALWTAPVISQIHLYTRLTGQSGPDLFNTILTQYGNPEFNNPGGLAVPLVDLGTVGGLLFFLVTGLLIGFAYRSWRSGNPVGLLVYPVLFTGLLELPRYLYWTQGRVFPALAFLLVVAGFMARSSRPRLLLSGTSNEQR